MNDSPSCCDGSGGRTVVRSVIERRPELDSSTDWDSVMGALSKRRRRYLVYLLAEESVASTEHIVDRILALEEEVVGGPERDRSEVMISLLHRDLPVLKDAELVTFDEDAQLIGRGERFSVALDLLDGAFGSPNQPER